MHTQLGFKPDLEFVQLLGASLTCKTTKSGPSHKPITNTL